MEDASKGFAAVVEQELGKPGAAAALTNGAKHEDLPRKLAQALSERLFRASHGVTNAIKLLLAYAQGESNEGRSWALDVLVNVLRSDAPADGSLTWEWRGEVVGSATQGQGQKRRGRSEIAGSLQRPRKRRAVVSLLGCSIHTLVHKLNRYHNRSPHPNARRSARSKHSWVSTACVPSVA